MKTMQQTPIQSKQPAFARWAACLPASIRRALLVAVGLWFAQTATLAQSNIFTGVFYMGANFAGYVNVAGQCNPAYEPKVYVYPNSGCASTTPWTVTITDSAGTQSPIGGLHLDVTTHSLRDSGGLLPVFNLTSLAAGDGTLKVTDPCGTIESFAMKIVACVGGVALVPEIGLSTRIAPNRAATFYAQVANVGVNDFTGTTTLEVWDILAAADCIVTSTEMIPGTTGSGQNVTATVGTVLAGAQTGFLFQMQATASAVIGSTFTVQAKLDPPFLATDSQLFTVVASIDPNAKYGPAGYGPLHSIPKKTTLPYLITFENDPSALAPAQIVTITDYLDTTKVDLASVQFGPVHFGSKVVAPPADVNPFSVTVPYDVDNNPLTTDDNIYVRISGSVDQDQFSGTYGKVEWMFESLDAPNGNPPPINIGFLPANIAQPEGDGGVTFTVSQKANLAPGTLITNVASIVFDVNAPILTPVWTNRIAVPSSLSLQRLNTGFVRVTWAGGALEQSSTVSNGIWTNAPVQVSPWTFKPTASQKFYRVRND